MNDKLAAVCRKYEQELIEFAQSLVRIRSYSDQEGDLAHCLLAKMQQLGYDEAFIDEVGNVVGRIGTEGPTIQFDSHMDTVEVHDGKAWLYPPFSGEIADGRLYGRGSVDMKSALAASVYAAVIARELGLTQGKTIYVTGTVCEEYCDGENLRLLYANRQLKPNYVIICEPSNNIITLGHKGKAQIRIKTHGVSAHGSAPEKGVNAVYEMAQIISRVDELNQRLSAKSGAHGTVVLSDISSVSASLNAVPSECAIYLDRRLVLGETEEDVRREMDSLIAGKRASWEIGTLRHTSWAGAELVYQPMHAPWKIAENHPFTQACNEVYAEVFGQAPTEYDFWDFGTNAVTPVSMGVPCIGFGPGEYKLAHMRDENCRVAQITEACQFYAALIGKLL